MMVSTPAAVSTPQSRPDADTVLVIMAAIGFASVTVSVLAINNSTQENIKQKKAAIPIPGLINGMNKVTKNLGKE